MESLEEVLVRPQAPIIQHIEVPVARRHSYLQAGYSFAIFLGAFLLFQIQLIIAKYLLPWFGGSAAVWTTCMLFFEVLLVGGYAYAHLLGSRFTEQRQSRIHIALLLGSLSVMIVLASRWPSPITPGNWWKPNPGGNPAWQLARLLALTVGIPFFVLSSTGPLMQRWFSRSFGHQTPYRLYSLSNIGSLLGLITYPFLFERFLRIDQQAWIWSVMFSVFVVSLGWVAVYRSKTGNAASLVDELTRSDFAESSVGASKPGFLRHLQWISLAACATAMLLSTTNLMCQQVAVIPLLWVLPLSLYLLSFVICFDSNRWLRRELYRALFFVSGLLALSRAVWNLDTSTKIQIASLSLAVFSLCLVCHCELAYLKPKVKDLTSFYLSIGIGGALGGVFVGVVAPWVFQSFSEFYVCLLWCSAMVAISLFVEKNSWIYRCPSWTPWLILLFAALLPATGLLVPTPFWLLIPYSPLYRTITIAIALAGLWAVLKRSDHPARGAWVLLAMFSVVAVLAYAAYDDTYFGIERVPLRARNFYGVKEVDKAGGQLSLINGRIVHGAQWMSSKRRNEPTMYYDRSSGIGRLIDGYPRAERAAGLRVGVVGLGVGTLAAYGQAGDYFRFYEIDPQVIRLSRGKSAYFTFIQDSPAKVDIIEGDARLSLEYEAARGELQRFDILVVDAFSGDAIPVHLVTREAINLYLSHLRGSDSVIAFHITNRHVDLKPVLLELSRDQGLSAIVARVKPTGHLEDSGRSSEWILLSRNPAVLGMPTLAPIRSPLDAERPILWTDNFSNLAEVLR